MPPSSSLTRWRESLGLIQTKRSSPWVVWFGYVNDSPPLSENEYEFSM